MTENQQIFNTLKTTAAAVQAVFGPNSEVAIYDIADLEKSLVHLEGNVSGRKVGAPATDLLIKLLGENASEADHRHNYKTVTADGRCLKSSTSLIRNSVGEVVAALCINLDTTAYFNAIQALLPFIHDLETGIYPSKENLAQTPVGTIRALFVEAVEEIGVQPGAMSIEEKTAFVRKMKQDGVFQIRGAVEEVSRLMDVTKCTVYNYLKKIE